QYLDRLGQGEFSTVFKAKINGELVAVKKYKQQSSQDEIQIMRGIIHANVVSIYGLVLGDKPGIVMELLDCTLLDAYHTQTISELEKTQISSDIASAMAFLHLKSVIHRDLKPSNILLDSNKKAKISDFGFSIVDADSSQLVGTIQYMAPEILEARKYSQQSDVYAFAIVFWEILHWKRAYEHIDMHQVRSSILDGDRLPLDGLDPDKQLLLNAMWQQDPSHRPLFQDICPILFQEQPLDSTITPPMSVFVPGSERYESADNFQMQDLFFKLNQLSSSRFKTNFPSLNTSQTSFRSNNSAYC
ncbi:kinase-like domain-containing protein, partial [Gorgonomyces haynaldii]